MLHFYWNAVLVNGQDIPQFDSEGKENSFSLIQEQDRNKQLRGFGLICKQDGLVHLAVDLKTGNFEIRGASFHPYNVLTTHEKELHYRVIFYRRMRRYSDQDIQFIKYFLIGWQCTYGGLNYQRIIFYNPITGGIEIKAKR